jgi:two-component system response regulator PilR (NtrC family)
MALSLLQNEPAAARRILITDDDTNVAFIFQAALEQLPNCTVKVAASGQEALRLFELEAFDLLITDYRMPGVDGLTLAARIRQTYPHTAIVMITAFSTAQLREQAAQVQIRRVCEKPIALDQLRDIAREALDTGVGH